MYLTMQRANGCVKFIDEKIFCNRSLRSIV